MCFCKNIQNDVYFVSCSSSGPGNEMCYMHTSLFTTCLANILASEVGNEMCWLHTCTLIKFLTKIGFLNYSLRLNRAKSSAFWEKYSNSLHDDEFRRFYRMDKSTFRALTSFLNPVTRNYQGGRVQVAPHKMVGITLFYLGSKVTYKALSGIFGLSEECVFHITEYILKLLNEKCAEVIKWPKKEDYECIAKEFNSKEKRQFPNIIGALDGCHIRISHAKEEDKAYYNYKHFHSIQLQAICLYNRRFIDIFVG